MTAAIPVSVAQHNTTCLTGGAAENQEEEEKHQKEGNCSRGAPENLSGQ